MWCQLSIRGTIRTVMYACGDCAHEWTIVHASESPGRDTDRWVGECPSCEHGRGVVRGVKIDRENRTRTYRCDDCAHQWVVTEASVA